MTIILLASLMFMSTFAFCQRCETCEKLLERNIFEEYKIETQKSFDSNISELLRSENFDIGFESQKNGGSASYGPLSISGDHERKKLKEIQTRLYNNRNYQFASEEREFIYKRYASKNILDSFNQCIKDHCSNAGLNVSIEEDLGDFCVLVVWWQPSMGVNHDTIVDFSFQRASYDKLILSNNSIVTTEPKRQILQKKASDNALIVINTKSGSKSVTWPKKIESSEDQIQTLSCKEGEFKDIIVLSYDGCFTFKGNPEQSKYTLRLMLDQPFKTMQNAYYNVRRPKDNPFTIMNISKLKEILKLTLISNGEAISNFEEHDDHLLVRGIDPTVTNCIVIAERFKAKIDSHDFYDSPMPGQTVQLKYSWIKE